MRYNLDSKNAVIFDDGLKPFCATTLTRSCEIVHSIFQHLKETENKVLYCSSFTTNQNEILRSLEKATNTRWSVENATTEGLMADARHRRAGGDQNAQMDLLMGAIYAPEFGSDWTEAAKMTNRILELEPEDIDKVTQELIEGKRPKKGIWLGLLGQYQ